MAQEVYAKLEKLANECDFDLVDSKKYSRDFRLEMSDKDLKKMGGRGLENTHQGIG